jgi:hypothetical protein
MAVIRPGAPPRYSRLAASPLTSGRPVLRFRNQAGIAFMPSLCRLPRRPYSSSRQRLSRTYPRSQVLTTSVVFRHLAKDSLAFISAIRTGRFLTAFSRSLTTTALNNSRTGRFGSNIGLPKPRDLLSSLIPHG